jgi:hypothetical protein
VWTVQRPVRSRTSSKTGGGCASRIQSSCSSGAAWFAYPKEIGKPGNVVLAVQRFLDCTLAESVKVVSDLSALRLSRFERLAVNASNVDSLRDWLAGHLLWHQVCTPAAMGGFRDRVVG